MKKEDSLLERLKRYGETDMYPFHMPGHKRQQADDFLSGFSSLFQMDITEIEGFDNLHNPEGILKKSMEWAASVYGSDRTYYLVNGSSGGILSAICGTTNNSDTILMSRNSHKSAYNGVFLNRLRAKYIYPQILDKYCVQGGLLPDEIEKMLKSHADIHAVFVVSPTYDGIVSDIKTIANIVHNYKIPLIVDEAHGAHFSYGDDFPLSALELGADVVIQSLHKTLPSLTQTALLHVKEGYVDTGKIERYLRMFQSSSPSYVFMAGIENCIFHMTKDRGRRMMAFAKRMRELRERLLKMEHLRLLDREVIGQNGVFDLDWSKVVISTKGTRLSGTELNRLLRERYHLEMEMCGAETVTAVTTFMDTDSGLLRLERALTEIDGGLDDWNPPGTEKDMPVFPEAEVVMDICDAVNGVMEMIGLEDSAGRISGEYVYVYPPGIPILVPGETVRKKTVDLIIRYKGLGLSVQGTKDPAVNVIQVLKQVNVC